MTGRWIVVVVVAVILLDVISIPMVYATPTWNWDHTEILTGWDNVVSINLILIPLAAAGLGITAAVVIALAVWASR